MIFPRFFPWPERFCTGCQKKTFDFLLAILCVTNGSGQLWRSSSLLMPRWFNEGRRLSCEQNEVPVLQAFFSVEWELGFQVFWSEHVFPIHGCSKSADPLVHFITATLPLKFHSCDRKTTFSRKKSVSWMQEAGLKLQGNLLLQGFSQFSDWASSAAISLSLLPPVCLCQGPHGFVPNATLLSLVQRGISYFAFWQQTQVAFLIATSFVGWNWQEAWHMFRLWEQSSWACVTR